MAYGLTADGFVAKTQAAILEEIEVELRGLLGESLNTSSASVIGQIDGVMSTKLRELWELGQAVHVAQYPDGAFGRSLTMLAALTGTQRRPATKSLVLASVNVNPGTYAAGTLIASVVGFPERRFVNRLAVVNGGVSAATIPAFFIAETAGPVLANSGTLTVKAQAVAGWNSITNALDATVGKVEETDDELRVRREQELAAAGSTTADAVRADILQKVSGVISCIVLENDTDVTDGNGVLPHSLECIVRGPEPATSDDDQALANQIWATKAGGTRAAGSTTKTVIDSQGRPHTVKFTRPSDVDLYIDIEVTTDPATYAGNDALKAALVAFGDANLGSGDDVIILRLAATALDVAGVLDVPTLEIGIAPSPSGTVNIAVALREIARIDTSRITVIP